MPSRRPLRRLAVLLAALVLPVAATARAAGPPAEADGYSGTSEVVSIEVPVHVVDRSGTPLRGLAAEQFEVFDDGVRQPIRGFEVVDLAGETVPPLAPGSASNEPIAARARRHFLLLFDLSFSTPSAVLKARLAARDFILQSLHPSDLVAVATFSLQRGPRLVVTFTPDRAQVARAIDTLGLRGPEDLFADSDPLQFMLGAPLALESLPGLASDERGGRSDVEAQRDQMITEHMRVIAHVADQSERQFQKSRITGFARSLGELARALHEVPGRKHVVYFSEGFDSRLMLGREPGSREYERDTAEIVAGRIWMTDSDARFGSTDVQNDVYRMLEEFRRADCVIQSIDISGLRADVRGPGESARGSGQEMLFYLANETGGELFRNANDFRQQLERVMQRSTLTYVLSFERGDLPADGAYHRLRVRVRDLPAGARVSHRVGYYAPRPFADLHPLEKKLLAAGGIAAAVPRRDIELAVLAAPFRATPQLAYVPVVMEIDGESLLADHSGERLPVEIYAYVSDAQGRMRDYFSHLVQLELAQARRILAAGGLKYYGHLDLPPGDYRVRVLVRNADNGRTGVQSLPLTVPRYDDHRPFLLPPLFIAAAGDWLLVRERTDEGGSSVVYPFTLEGEPYVPAARPVVDGEGGAELCVVGYNLGRGPLELEAHVEGADGSALAGGRVDLVERTATGIEGLDKLRARFEPRGLAAGDYVLHLSVGERESGRRELSSLQFTVR
jgi:VWFA-related protein